MSTKVNSEKGEVRRSIRVRNREEKQTKTRTLRKRNIEESKQTRSKRKREEPVHNEEKRSTRPKKKAKTKRALPEDWWCKLPGAIAWKKGEKQWKKLRDRLDLAKGTWVAVNGEGNYVTADSENKLIRVVEKRKWFSPYYECVGIPVPPQIARVARGHFFNVARKHVGRIAYGTSEPNFTTSISGEMRNTTTARCQCLC